jgi:hypothetical protein
MRRPSLTRHLASLATLLGALCACTPTHYQNVTHPGYGDTEYQADLAQCRRENSTVEIIEGYDTRSVVRIDEAKVSSCIAARGWQPTNK